MSLPLPNLDDRRWPDLVEEGRSLIQLYEPGWTDHNAHDPGIMLLELLAWVAEMDIYWLNQIPDDHRRTFLSLVGIRPADPTPARVVTAVTLRAGSSPLALPAATQFAGQDRAGQSLLFTLRRATTLVPGKIEALQVFDGTALRDLTARWRRGEPLPLFGTDPRPGSAFYLGLSHSLPAGTPATLHLSFAGECRGEDERLRLEQELERRRELCQAPPGLTNCAHPDQPVTSMAGLPLQHHSARTVWEYLDARGRWRLLDRQAGEVLDETRAGTLDGRVVVSLPSPPGSARLGDVPVSLPYLRCRLVDGRLDEAPLLESVVLNGLELHQAAAAGTLALTIQSQATVEGPAPPAGGRTRLAVELASAAGAEGFGRPVSRLLFGADSGPELRVLAYQPPSAGADGQLLLEADALAPGNGRPEQRRPLNSPVAHGESLSLYTWEEGIWRSWRRVNDFAGSGPDQADYLIDFASGSVLFPDGQNGLALPRGALPLAAYESTAAEAGNVDAGGVSALPDNPHNRALLADVPATAALIQQIRNPLPARGGRPAETVDQAAGRALNLTRQVTRAVTLEDYETLALQTPGTCLARVAARANLHPAFPCFKARGLVTVIVLPSLPAGRPEAGPGLLRAVRSYLGPRRVLGTGLLVVGPSYFPVTVHAQVRPRPAVDPGAVQTAILASLERFFDPLLGGPEGKGWPFGRDVYRSEVLQVIDETPGVDHVLSLELFGADCEPSCGNLCLGPLGLIDAGEHRIEVSSP